MPEDLTGLLEKLRQLDPDTFGDLYITLANFIHDVRPWEERKAGGKAKIENFQPTTPMEQNVYDAIIQGGIQRAISTRDWHIQQGMKDDGWRLQQGFGGDSAQCWAYIFLDKEYLGEGDSPAFALLAAYVKSLEGQT